MKKLLLVIIGIVLIIGFMPALETGDKAEPFANMDLNGKFYMSKNYYGDGWLILDFFATYCIPCKEEIPELEILLEEFGEKGLNCFVMATDKDGRKIVAPYFDETPTSLEVLIDRYMVTAKTIRSRFNTHSVLNQSRRQN